MKNYMNKKLALILVILSVNAYSATYISNHDGDTLKVQENGIIKTLRLAYVDAQELKQSFGYEAKELIADTCKNADIKYIETGTSSYNRSVAEVYCDDLNIGGLLLIKGLARLDSRYPVKNISYIDAENVAKNKMLRVHSGFYSEPKTCRKDKTKCD
jgi:endonuclease YncB( thermonuclease family)